MQEYPSKPQTNREQVIRGEKAFRQSQHVDLIILRRKVSVDHRGVYATVPEPLGDLVDADAL